MPGKLDEARVYSFESTRFQHIRLSYSNDGLEWTDIEPTIESANNTESSYAYLRAKLYRVAGDVDFRYLKVFFQKEAQIGRVEILYR